jgi:hypothetical protein
VIWWKIRFSTYNRLVIIVLAIVFSIAGPADFPFHIGGRAVDIFHWDILGDWPVADRDARQSLTIGRDLLVHLTVDGGRNDGRRFGRSWSCVLVRLAQCVVHIAGNQEQHCC